VAVRKQRIRTVAALVGLVAALLAPAVPAATLFGLVDTGELFISADDGVNWAPLSTLPVRDATALAARFSSSDLFLASRSGSIYRSQDAGMNWSAVGAIPASDLEDLAIRPDGTILVLSAAGSIYSSGDQGASFTPLATLTGSNFASLTFTTPGTVKFYALTRTGEVYESTDGGAAWTPKGAMAISNARRMRAVDSSLYVMTESGDVFRSTDAATHWIAVGTLSQVGMRGLVRNGSSLAAASKEGHVATSANGASWTWQGSMNQLAVTALASNEPATTGVDPGGPGPGIFLGAPFPNPSSVALSLAVRLDREDEVRLALYDIRGRRVAERAPESLAAGPHVLRWDPGVHRAGVYIVHIETASLGSAARPWAWMKRPGDVP
jgi:photosystem II stability/assembly factor-like uncharacterized protein